MAEGWVRAIRSNVIEPYSAGTDPGGLNPLAVKAMLEAGVDISAQMSKRVDALCDIEFDFVVTVCDAASDACPAFRGSAKVLHIGFDDPPKLALAATTDEEALPHYRRVRDEIRRFVETLPEALQGDSTMPDRTCCDDSCCPPSGTNAEAIRANVRAGYAQIAQTGSCGPSGSGGGCCGPTAFTPAQLAKAVGYSSEELRAMPEGANMGLSCGNPTAIASLRAGEVVLDLGAGGGFDCFVAGPKVGATGRVIGVDMTPDMLTKARRNIASYRAQTGLDNVEFRLGEIEALPVPDLSVDVVISNCVLNLSVDKARVWREIVRVLKPGGRVAVSDLALLRPLPSSVKADVEALVGCVAGAILVEDTRAMATAAGLTDVVLKAKPQYVDAMTDWNDPLYQRVINHLPPGSKPSDYIISLDITAVKR